MLQFQCWQEAHFQYPDVTPAWMTLQPYKTIQVEVAYRAFLLSSLISIACIKASSSLSVICPCSQTKPTKLKFTRRSAGNMHAALILLNWPLTFGTGLWVCQNPVHVLRLSTVLQYPLVDSFTINRAMCLLPTLQTNNYCTLNPFLLTPIQTFYLE
jgi:hypothetical protein